MIVVMVDVDNTATAALSPATTTDPHLADAPRALHQLAALWIARHHGHNRLTFWGGKDRLSIFEITGSFHHTVHENLLYSIGHSIENGSCRVDAQREICEKGAGVSVE